MSSASDIAKAIEELNVDPATLKALVLSLKNQKKKENPKQMKALLKKCANLVSDDSRFDDFEGDVVDMTIGYIIKLNGLTVDDLDINEMFMEQRKAVVDQRKKAEEKKRQKSSKKSKGLSKGTSKKVGKKRAREEPNDEEEELDQSDHSNQNNFNQEPGEIVINVDP